MKRRRMDFLSLLLALAVLLSTVCFAQEQTPCFAGRTLDGVLAEFRQAHHLNEYNFAFSYYNTVTGERCNFNETEMMIAASTYKMPLNLYYYRMELDGQIESDAWIPEAGVTLDVAHERSLVDSNNEISEGMMYHLGRFREYKEKMRDFFTMTDVEISEEYYTGNFYCTRMMVDALQYLYEHSEQYEQMLGYMQKANRDSYFCRLVTEYPVAHKYGSYEGSENDVGIIYAPQPFLLAVYSHNEDICAQVARLVTDYTVYYAELYEKEQQAQAEAEAQEAAKRAAEELSARRLAEQQAKAQAAEEKQEPQLPETPDEDYLRGTGQGARWWMIVVAAVVLLLGGGLLAIVFGKPGKFEKKYKKRYAKYLQDDTINAKK